MHSLQTLAEAHVVIILGLGREGWSSTQFITQNFPDHQLILIDDKPIASLQQKWQELLENNSHIRFFSSAEWLSYVSNDVTNFATADKTVVVKTPGISLQHPFFTWVKSVKLPIITNTQLFFELVSQYNEKHTVATFISDQVQLPALTIIGVTGTKGKSTTSAAIYHLLHTQHMTALLGGNIGEAPLNIWLQIVEIQETHINTSVEQIYVVLELSAHQLSELDLSPHISIVQNVTPEHLDYYADFEEYWQAKQHICQYQKSTDIVIFNPTYALPKTIASSGKAQQITFSQLQPTLEPIIENHFSFDKQAIYLNGEVFMALSQVKVPGVHNLENLIPAAIIGSLLNVPPAEIQNTLQTFTGLPHRLEFVAEYSGITFFNDSLSTTPVATIAALDTFTTQSIILIAGGYERNLDYTELAHKIIAKQLKYVILFPTTGSRIAEALTAVNSGNQLPALHFVTTMDEALSIIKEVAQPGNIVLLSPASPSFGIFKDYADRGDQFKQAAKKYF